MLDFLKKKNKEVEKSKIEKEFDAGVESLASYALDSEEYGLAADNLEKVQRIKNGEKESNTPKDNWFVAAGKRVLKTLTHPTVIATAISAGLALNWGNRCMEYDHEGQIPPVKLFNNGHNKFTKVEARDED